MSNNEKNRPWRSAFKVLPTVKLELEEGYGVKDATKRIHGSLPRANKTLPTAKLEIEGTQRVLPLMTAEQFEQSLQALAPSPVQAEAGNHRPENSVNSPQWVRTESLSDLESICRTTQENATLIRSLASWVLRQLAENPHDKGEAMPVPDAKVILRRWTVGPLRVFFGLSPDADRTVIIYGFLAEKSADNSLQIMVNRIDRKVA